MHDGDVRIALHRRLAADHAHPETLVRDELGLCVGNARVDVAVINGHLAGYEIKSERDRLDRLERQVGIYGLVLDIVVLVAAAKHVERAGDRIPSWWGLWLAEPSDSVVRLSEVRAAAPNPRVDPLAVAQLLWRPEALALLTERGLDRGMRTANRWRLWGALVELLEPQDLATEVRARLRARPLW